MCRSLSRHAGLYHLTVYPAYPAPSRPCGIFSLAEFCELIPGDQSVAGKILHAKNLAFALPSAVCLRAHHRISGLWKARLDVTTML